MKVVKVTKKMLKMHPADLLVQLGLVNKEKKLAFPERVYFSKEDYKELKQNLTNYAKKKLTSSSKRIIDYSVGVDLLNYGPNESLADALKPGFALIDSEGL